MKHAYLLIVKSTANANLNYFGEANLKHASLDVS